MCCQADIAQAIFFIFWFISPFLALLISIYVKVKLNEVEAKLRRCCNECSSTT